MPARKTRKLPILISRPHCSAFIPEEIRPLLGLTQWDIKDYADLYTDEIFNVPQAHMLTAEVSRFVADLNRAPDHLLTQAELSYEGVVAAITDSGKEVFKHPPNLKTIKRWIRKYHHPYHRKIKQILPKVRFFIDGHSMYGVGSSHKPDAGEKRADIVLGNREYSTCSLATTNFIRRFFEKKGYLVKVNKPYAGKYIIGAHCSRHWTPGIQIEINKDLYMNSKTLGRKRGAIKKLNREVNELVHVLLSDHLKITI